MESGGRVESTDETEAVELVECGEGTEALCSLFVCVVAYGRDLGDGVEEEGAAVEGVSGEKGGRKAQTGRWADWRRGRKGGRTGS